MKAIKTFKIGEYCKGGIITVEIYGKVIIIIGKEWDYSAGTKKSSNQKNAKEWIRGTTETTNSNALYLIEGFLNDLTTSYHASKITDWIKTKVKI